jgi:hypothetical protein
MEIEELVSQTRKVRDMFHEALGVLVTAHDQNPDFSFAQILKRIQEVKEAVDRLEEIAKSDKLSGNMDPEFVCAFIGDSNSGKSSVLEVMFPDLARQGWLPTQVKDTTSQILRIKSTNTEVDQRPSVIYPWNFPEISNLTNLAHSRCSEAKIIIRNSGEQIEVDGSDSSIDDSIKNQYKFGLRQTLRPFINPYPIPEADFQDSKYILHLITKVDRDKVDPLWNITLDGVRFNSLQLRANVKYVETYDDFSKIKNWCGDELGEYSGNIVFLDTPGLKTGGSENDEVLGYILANKNTQIVNYSIGRDELDVIVNLVLIPSSTSIGSVFDSVRSFHDEEIEDLDDRLIIAVNGFHRYLTEFNLNRVRKDRDAAAREGDHFALTLKSNILNKLSIHKKVNPASIVFLDAKKYAQNESGNRNYVEVYKEIEEEMMKCLVPNEIGFSTLEELRLLDSFPENIRHLADSEDCGTGFLVKQIVRLIKANGPKYYIRKFLRKSGLIGSIKSLRELLSEYYDGTGKLNSKNISDAVNLCLSSIPKGDLKFIDNYCGRMVDPRIDALELQTLPGDSDRWVKEAFRKTCSIVLSVVLHSTKDKLKKEHRILAEDDQLVFNRYVSSLANKWIKEWGYSKIIIPKPTEQDPSSGDIIRHALKFHAREIVHQLISSDPDNQGLENLVQSPDDQKMVKDIMEKLKNASDLAETMCRRYGVNSK